MSDPNSRSGVSIPDQCHSNPAPRDGFSDETVATELLLSQAMQAAGMGAWEMDCRTNQIKWSFAHFALFDLRAEDFDGRPETALSPLHPQDRDRVWRDIEEAQRNRHCDINQDFRVIWRDGSIHWITSRARIQYSPAGDPLRIIGVNWDVTEQKFTADLLAASEKKLSTSLQILPQPFGVYSSIRNDRGKVVDFRVDYANPAALADLGRSASQYVGRSLCEVLPGHREHGLLDAYIRVVETGNPFHAERFRFCGEFGGQAADRWYEIHVTKLNDGFVAVWQNITDRVQAEQQLARTNQRLQALMDALPVGVSFSEDPSCTRITGNKAAASQFEGAPDDNLSPSAMDTSAPGPQVRYSRNGRPLNPEELPLQRAVAENRKIPGEEIEVELPSGRRWIAEASGAPINDESGNVTGGLAVIIDITERKRAQEALQASESLYRASFNNAAVGIAHVGLDGRWLRFNDAVCKITGYSREELLTKTFADITHPDDIDADWAQVHDLLAGKFPSYDMDKRYIRKDGSTVWIHLTVSLHCETENAPQHMISVIEDISEQRRAQAALQESERRFRELAESLPQLIWVTDRHGENTYCNQRFLDYTGVAPGEMLGMAWSELLHPDDLEPTVRRWNRSLASGEPYLHEYRLRNKDGEYRHFLARAVPVTNSKGEIEQWLGSSTDIHDQKLAEEALRRTEKLAVAGRLAMSISHEINNPMAAVTNLVYLVKSDPGLSDAARKYIQMAERELDRVSHVVTQTLRFGKLSLQPRSTDLREVTDSVIELFNSRFHSARIAIERDYRTDISLQAYPHEIRQVVANILSNAHDAMRHGGRLKIRIRNSNSWDSPVIRGVRLTIADTGVGIDPRLRKRIFEPFVSTKEETGTGLGLWVSREIIQKHQGRISVRSSIRPGHSGTVFSIFLPLNSSATAALSSTAYQQPISHLQSLP